MKITLHDVSKGRGGQALPTTSLEFHTGAVRFALAETLAHTEHLRLLGQLYCTWNEERQVWLYHA